MSAPQSFAGFAGPASAGAGASTSTSASAPSLRPVAKPFTPGGASASAPVSAPVSSSTSAGAAGPSFAEQQAAAVQLAHHLHAAQAAHAQYGGFLSPGQVHMPAPQAFAPSGLPAYGYGGGAGGYMSTSMGMGLHAGAAPFSPSAPLGAPVNGKLSPSGGLISPAAVIGATGSGGGGYFPPASASAGGSASPREPIAFTEAMVSGAGSINGNGGIPLSPSGSNISLQPPASVRSAYSSGAHAHAPPQYAAVSAPAHLHLAAAQLAAPLGFAPSGFPSPALSAASASTSARDGVGELPGVFQFGARAASSGGLGPGAGAGAGGSALGGGGRRGGRGGPPVHTPLKTSNHNSTPSVQLNPAAFAAMLAAGGQGGGAEASGAGGAGTSGAAPAGRIKRKAPVALPHEGSETDAAKLDEMRELEAEIEAEAEDEADAEADASRDEFSDSAVDMRASKPAPSSSDKKAAAAKAERRARLAALQAISYTRARWVRRVPLRGGAGAGAADGARALPLPQQCMVSRGAHPEEAWDFRARGLPDTIDIYLPGQAAWLEYIELRYEEIEREEALRCADAGEAADEPNEAAEDGAWDEEQPIDTSEQGLISFKMQKYLQSQSQADGEAARHQPHDPNEPLQEEAEAVAVAEGSAAATAEQEQGDDDNEKPSAAGGLFGRLTGMLPPRLREAALAQIGKRGGAAGAAGAGAAPGAGAHGHSMSLVLPPSGASFGLEALSALGLRATSDKAASDAGAGAADDTPALGPRPSVPRGKSVGDAASPIADAPDAQQAQGPTPAWKSLGQGFGYDLEDEDGGAPEHADADADADDEDQIEDDLRTNPSEDADTSDLDEPSDPVAVLASSSAARRRRPPRLSPFGVERGSSSYEVDSGDDVDVGGDSDSDDVSEQYSNPSDEEAARVARIERREQRMRQRQKAQGRKRALTACTLPSSGLGEGEERTPMGARLLQRRASEVISNPSDEDNLDYGTFGESDDPAAHIRPASATLSSVLGNMSQQTPSRSALNPTAQEFSFGRPRAAEASPGHFRLPSIQHSSFGGSAFEAERRAERKSLSANAPTFTPGKFTFQAPGGAPKLPPMPATAPPPLDLSSNAPAAGDQGREKRQRFGGARGPLDDASADVPADFSFAAAAPAKPGVDAASIMPTWGRANGAAIVNLLSGQAVNAPPAPIAGPLKSAPPFLAAPVSKPISIRRPDEAAGTNAAPLDGADDVAARSSAFAFPAQAPAGAKSGLSSLFEKPQAQAPAAKQPLSHARDASISLSDVPGRQAASSKADDEEELQDIIEELGQRMDRSIQAWAGRIMEKIDDKSTAVAPAPAAEISGPAPVTLPESQRQALRSDIEATVASALNEWFPLITAKVEAIAASADPSLDSNSSVDASGGKARGRGSLDAQGELDFDYVQETLDTKISALHEGIASLLTSALADRDDDKPAPTPPEMSAEAVGRIADTVGFRVRGALDNVQAVLLDAVHEPPAQVLKALGESEQNIRASLAALQPANDVIDELAKKLPQQIDSIEASLHNAKGTIAEQVEMSVVNAITPHLESLRQEALDPEVFAARITSNLIPVLDAHKGPTSQGLATEVAELVRQQLPTASPSDSLDTSAIISGLQSTLSQELREHNVNLDPVVALIEPLVEKHEDTKTISKQILMRQEEMDNTLSILPSAFNAKTEVFLSATQQTHETTKTILDRLSELADKFELSELRAHELEEERDLLRAKLEESQATTADRHLEAAQARAELDGTNKYVATLQEQVARLEAQLEEQQRAGITAAEQLTDLRSRQRDALEAQYAAERRADEAVHRAQALEGEPQRAAAAHTATQERLEEAIALARADREERAREREEHAQATAALAARLERAERAAEDAARRADAQAQQATAREEALRRDADAQRERAARAEGEAAGLDRRGAELDAKVASLQSLAAAQKHKAATAQQRIAELETKAADADALRERADAADKRAEQLEAGAARLQELEDKVRAALEAQQTLRSQLSASEAARADALAQVAARADADAQARAEKAGLLAEKADLLAEKRDLLAENAGLLTKKAGLLAEKADLLTDKARLQADNENLRGDVEQLQRRVSEQERAAASASASASVSDSAMATPKRGAAPQPQPQPRQQQQPVQQRPAAAAAPAAAPPARTLARTLSIASASSAGSARSAGTAATTATRRSAARTVVQDAGGWWS